MKLVKKFLLQILAVVSVANAVEIGFVSYTSNPDSFQFVALSSIAGGEQILFTDNGVHPDGTFRANEGTCVWTAPAGGVSIGTVVSITSAVTNVGVVESNSMNLANGGDQVVAYQGTSAAPIFVAAITLSSDGLFQEDATSSGTTALPPGLVLGESAIALELILSYVYTGPTVGQLAEITSALFDPENFAGSGSGTEFTGGDFSISVAPTAPTVPSPAPTESPTTPAPTKPPTVRPDIEFTSTSCVGYDEAPFLVAGQRKISEVNDEILEGETGQASVGSAVVLEGVVVSDLRSFGANSFFIQSPRAHEPLIPVAGEPSQGMQIYCGAGCTIQGDDFEIGDYVRVSGTTAFFRSNAQLIDSTTEVLVKASESGFQPEGANCPKLAYAVHIVDVPLPYSSRSQLFSYRNMLVNILNENVSITNTFELRYGSLSISGNGILTQPTMLFPPASPEYFQYLDFNSRNFLVLDDVAGGECPETQLYFNPDASGVRTGWTIPGDVFDGTTIMTFLEVSGDFNIIPNSIGQALIPNSYNEASNPRHATIADLIPELDASKIPLRVSGMNMLNYFTELDDGDCSECRGANTAKEFALQSAKLYSAIAELDAAVFGLQEVQNFGGDAVLQQLVDELNDFIGVAGKFDFIPLGVLGGDAIKSAIIYQPELVDPLGDTATLTFVNPPDKSRPAVAQTFAVKSDELCGESTLNNNFTIVVNHLKSKGSACSEDSGSSNALEGEGNCGFTRLTHANQLLAWLETDPTGMSSENVVLVGDFNTYKEERAIKAITNSGFINMAERDAPAEELYSLSFDGVFGTLDYMLASPGFASKCSGTFEWHINSPEPILTDYNDEQYNSGEARCDTKPENFHEVSVFRTSDHDPIITFCQFECPSGIVPTSSPVETPPTLPPVESPTLPPVQSPTSPPVATTSSPTDGTGPSPTPPVTMNPLPVVTSPPNSSPGSGEDVPLFIVAAIVAVLLIVAVILIFKVSNVNNVSAQTTRIVDGDAEKAKPKSSMRKSYKVQVTESDNVENPVFAEDSV